MMSKMKHLSGLGLLALASQACSSNSAAIDGRTGSTIDAASHIDAASNHIDANVVVNVDAAIISADAHPTTALGACPGVVSTEASNSITITGVTDTIGFTGPAATGGVTVSALSTTSATALASVTSTATTGDYSLSITTTGTSIDGYLLGQLSGSLDTYVFPSAEIAASLSGVPVILITSGLLSTLEGLAGVTQTDTNGVVLVAVLDTSGNPVSGAVVTSTPASTVRYSGASGVPTSSATSTAADGVAYLLNVPAGCVSVTGTATDSFGYSTSIIHALPSSTAISLTQVIQTAQ